MTARLTWTLFRTLGSLKRWAMSISWRLAATESFLGKGGRLYWPLRMCRCVNRAARNAPEEMPYMRSFRCFACFSTYSVPAARSSAPFEMSQLIGRDLSERP